LTTVTTLSSAASAGILAKSLYGFVPVWDAQKDAITTYRCHAIEEINTGEPVGRQAQFKLALLATIANVRQATEILLRRLAAGDRFLLWLPISYDVLGSPIGRMEISALCRSLPGELRPYLIFEISDLPYGVAQSRLSDLVASLRPFCRGVMAQLPPRIPNYGAYLDAGLYAIGVSFAANVTGADMGSEIFKLSVAARRQRIVPDQHAQPAQQAQGGAHDIAHRHGGRRRRRRAGVDLLAQIAHP